MWVLIHLVLLAAEDCLEGQLFLPVIAELGMTGAVRCMARGEEPAILPGILALLLGKISREQIGYGDGWLLLALGFWMDGRELYRLFLTGMLLCCGAAWYGRKKELPFVPFLAAAYLLIGGWR